MTFQELKDLADKLEVQYHHLSGADKIEKQLRKHCEETLGKSLEEIAAEYGYTCSEIEDAHIKKLAKRTFDDVDKDAVKQSKLDAYKKAMKLVRCTITCNNKNKTNYTGEIFSVRNAVVEEVKKFVQFGKPTHVPAILLNMIKEKQYQMFKKTKLPNGNIITENYLTPEYNVQELPPLTPEEFQAIRRKQLAEGGAV